MVTKTFKQPVKQKPATPGFTDTITKEKNWTPLAGVSLGITGQTTATDGIKTRGNGAAQRGIKARGPMA